MASFEEFIETNFPEAKIIREGYEGEQSRGEIFSLTESGSPRIRRMFPVSRYTFTLRVTFIPRASVATIRAAYDETPDEIDTITDPLTGVTFDVTWIEPPVVVDVPGNFAIVEFKFYGTVQ